jgi:pyridoxamine--pyruvate transaminase
MPFEYEPIYLERYTVVERKVAQVFGTDGDVVLMMGEAVLGLEAAAKGLVRPGMKCLNLVSGIFGKWFGDWLRALDAEVIEIEVPWNEAIDPAAVERALSADPDIRIVSLVHSETPSGSLNPIAQIGPIARAAGALVITDAVSAFAGTPIESAPHLGPGLLRWSLSVSSLLAPPSLARKTSSWRRKTKNWPPPQSPGRSFTA